MKKYEFLYKSLLIMVASTCLLVLGNVAFAVETVIPNFTGLETTGDITVGGTLITDTLDSASGIISVTAGTLDAGGTDLSVQAFDSVTAQSWLVQAGQLQVDSSFGSYVDGSITAESLDVSGTVDVGDDISLDGTNGIIAADEIGNFYIKNGYCTSGICSGGSYYNWKEVSCMSGDIVLSCEAYAFQGSSKTDMYFYSPYDYTYPSVLTWSPDFESCVGRVDTDEAGLYVQALCYDPDDNTTSGYYDPDDIYLHFR